MIKIVIIDDEKWIRKLVIKLLPHNKFSMKICGEAEDGIEGLKLIKDCKPDIIITDIRMPLLSGLELIKRVNKEHPSSQIIVISGYDNFDYAQKAIKYGVVDFILKPIEQHELENAIRNAVKRQRKDGTLKMVKHLESRIKRLTNNAIVLSNNDFPEITNPKIRQSLKYIQEHYQDAISLNSVCDAVLLNSSYFSDLFKKEVGKGFNQYLIDTRFAEAKRLLVEKKELSIGDISTIVGFQDSNYFSRLFKKSFNNTPAKFRENSLLQD